ALLRFSLRRSRLRMAWVWPSTQKPVKKLMPSTWTPWSMTTRAASMESRPPEIRATALRWSDIGRRCFQDGASDSSKLRAPTQGGAAEEKFADSGPKIVLFSHESVVFRPHGHRGRALGIDVHGQDQGLAADLAVLDVFLFGNGAVDQDVDGLAAAGTLDGHCVQEFHREGYAETSSTGRLTRLSAASMAASGVAPNSERGIRTRSQEGRASTACRYCEIASPCSSTCTRTPWALSAWARAAGSGRSVTTNSSRV